MKIVYNYPPFQKALKALWPQFTGTSVCAVENGKPLGGCGFSPVQKGITSGWLLSLTPKWASKDIYVAIMRFPFDVLGAKKVIAVTGGSIASSLVCRRLGGKEVEPNHFVFTKADCELAERRLLEDK